MTRRSGLLNSEIWFSKDKNNGFTLAKIDQKFFYENDCDSAAISKHYIMGQNVGLQGTPAIILENGHMVNGYVSATELSNIISSLN